MRALAIALLLTPFASFGFGSSTSSASSSVAGGGSGFYLSTCAAVGCRLSLGHSDRYLVDDGAYFTLNTGLNVSGNVLVNIYGSGESGFQNVRTGTVGDATNPTFTIGRIIAGGINKPVFRWMYSADGVTERQVLDIESSGTFASILDNNRRSAIEAYNGPGLVYPIFRLGSSTGSSGLELSAGGSRVLAGQASCSANVVTVTTEIAHGFEVGQSIDVEAAELADDTHMPEASTYTVATTPTSTTFTATASSCTNGTTTVIRYVSADTDVFMRRRATNGGIDLISGVRDGTTSSSVGGFTLKLANDITDSDMGWCFARSDDTCVFSITEAGTFSAYQGSFVVNGSGVNTTRVSGGSGNPSLTLIGQTGDGASKVGLAIDQGNEFTTAGAKLLSVRNNGTEKASIDKDGAVQLTGLPTGSLPTCNASTKGQIQYDTTTNKHVGCNGTTWNNLY